MAKKNKPRKYVHHKSLKHKTEKKHHKNLKKEDPSKAHLYNPKKDWRIELIFIIIFLILLAIFIGIYVQNESEIGVCQKSSDCGSFKVWYMRGDGYVCANDAIASSIHERINIRLSILMFKYSLKKAVQLPPTACSCVKNQCEISD